MEKSSLRSEFTLEGELIKALSVTTSKYTKFILGLWGDFTFENKRQGVKFMCKEVQNSAEFFMKIYVDENWESVWQLLKLYDNLETNKVCR